MKIGVIGTGNWGKNIVKTLSDLGVLAGIAEVDAQLRQQQKEFYADQPVYDNYRELIESDVKAVAIATPVPTHYKIAKEAMSAGKDVFVEKPMTLTVKEAEDLVNEAEQKQRILMVGHLLLYQPAIQWIKRFMDAGKLGKVYGLYQERSKLGRVRSVENVLWSFGVHDIAVLLYLVGESPHSVSALGNCALQKNVADDVYLHMCFKKDVKAHLHNTWLWPKVERELVVIGEKGMLVYDELKQEVVLHHKRVDKHLTHYDEGEEVVFEGKEEPLMLEMKHFIECVEERKTPISDGENGLEVIRVLESTEEFLQS